MARVSRRQRAKARLCHARPGRWAILAALVGCAVLAGCAAEPQVPRDDATAIFRALEEGQLFSRQICGNLQHPLSPVTRHAYALMIKASAGNPNAELQSPDFTDYHPPIRTWLRGAAEAIAVCRRQVPVVGSGWRELQVRLQQAASRPALP